MSSVLFARSSSANSIADFPVWRIGLSSATSWSWGVSIALGMHFMKVYGVLPALAWMIGNVLALPLLGAIRHYLPSSRWWTRISVLYLLFIGMELMALVLNLTATQNALSGNLFNATLPSFSYISANEATWVTMAVGLFIVFFINRFGLRGSVLTDIGQYAFQLGAVLLLAITAIMFGESDAPPLVTEKGEGWWFFGFSGIIVGALSHFQQHQRFEGLGDTNNLRVGLWAGLFFGFYMSLVFVSGFFFSNHFLLGLLYLIVILAVATSTMDSAVAGLQGIAAKFSLPYWVGSLVALLTVIAWTILPVGTLDQLFNVMAGVRLPVIIAMIGSVFFYEALKRAGIINNSNGLMSFGRRTRFILRQT
jgi:hypothetical protein